MRKVIFAVVLALSGAGACLAAQPLLSPGELKSQLSQPALRLIDIRDAKAYSTGHIPGAVNAPYGKWRGPTGNPGELPSLPQLSALVRSLGLEAGTHAVVISSGADATDFGAAARVYWTLKVLGLKELSLLNGGEKAWADAGLPQDAAVVQVTPSTYQPQLDASLIAPRDEVARDIQQGSAVLVDARPKDFFEGQTRHLAAKVPGTLQGAVSVPYGQFFDGENSGVLQPEKVRASAAAAGDASKPAVAFCNTGHWAATDWFALSEVLGRKNVKLYPGSMVDWTQAPGALPVANEPGRAKQLLIDAKLWADRTFN